MFSGWQKHFEIVVWLSALILLYFMEPEQQHFSLCIPSALGFSWCPGCGIGHSIHYALHLDFANAWREHYFGIPATGIILYRIIHLLRIHKPSKLKRYGTTDL